MKKFTSALLAALIASAGTFAFAHGDEAHAKKAGPAKKEQKEWGVAGEAKAVSRTITLNMTDNMRFTPDKIDVKQGDTIRFVIKNSGKIMHEMVIGNKKDLDEHAAMMVKFPGMEHEEPYMVHVGPGKTGDIIWTFNKPGSFDFACLIAGHYQAGMVGKINVAAGKASSKEDGHDHKH